MQAVGANSLVYIFCCHEEVAPDPSLPGCASCSPFSCGAGAAAARRPAGAGWDAPVGSVRGRRGAGSPWSFGRRADQRSLPRSLRSRSSLPFFQDYLGSAEVPGKGGITPGSREPPRRLCRGAVPRPSPFPAPRPWPRQAARSAEDESRSLVSPLAAIAVKLEQRPANKAPPPLRPPPPLPEALHFTQVPTGEFAHLLLLFA